MEGWRNLIGRLLAILVVLCLCCVGCQRTPGAETPEQTEFPVGSVAEDESRKETPGATTEEASVSETATACTENSETSEEETAGEQETTAEVQGSTTGEDEITTEAESETSKVVEGAYEYVIDELNVSLYIPNELYVYRIDGLYLDWNSKVTSFEFAEWIIVTDRQYTEDYLESGFASNIKDEETHIVFGVELPVEAERYPLCLLGTCYFRGESRWSEQGYVKLIRPTDAAVGVGSYLQIKNNLYESEMFQGWISDWEKTVEDCTSRVNNITVMTDWMLKPQGIALNPYSRTMLDEAWWGKYSAAVSELEAAAEKYRYEAAEKELRIKDARERLDSYIMGAPSAEENGKLKSIDMDAGKDIHLRACLYANMSVETSETVSLEAIGVVYLDWVNGQRSYYGTYRNGNGELELIGCGQDYVVDLRPAYQYLSGISKE